jgi:hypothetical protein
MTRLEGLTGQATPVLSDLGDVAPEINAFIRDLGPFSQAAVPALDTLGDAAAVGGPALEDALPITRDLRAASRPLRPVVRVLSNVLGSLDGQDGFQRIMDYIFFQVAAVNGFDSYGHYLRAALIVNTCSTYSAVEVPGCLAKFGSSDSAQARASRAAASDQPKDPYLERVRRILAGEPLEDVIGVEEARTNTKLVDRLKKRVREAALEREQAAAGGNADAAPLPAPSATTTPGDAPAGAPAGDEVDTLLDYLFGAEE